MVEIVRTNDLVLISVIESLLRAAGVGVFVADQHMSAVEGSLGFLPRRILVDAASRRGRDGCCATPALPPNCAMVERAGANATASTGRSSTGGSAAGSNWASRRAAIASGPTRCCSPPPRRAPARGLIDVGAGVGAVGLALLRARPAAAARPGRDRPGARRAAGGNTELNGLGRARARRQSVVGERWRPARGGARRRRGRSPSSPTRRSSRPGRCALRPMRGARARMSRRRSRRCAVQGLESSPVWRCSSPAGGSS